MTDILADLVLSQWLCFMLQHAPRGFAVLDPLKVTLVNFPTAGDARLDESGVQWIEDVPIFPRNPEKGSRRMPLSNELYIDRSDFRMEDEKGYYGLAPGKTVGLRYGGLMKCVDVVTDPSGTPTEIIAEYTFEREVKVKGTLWVDIVLCDSTVYGLVWWIVLI